MYMQSIEYVNTVNAYNFPIIRPQRILVTQSLICAMLILFLFNILTSEILLFEILPDNKQRSVTDLEGCGDTYPFLCTGGM